MGRKDIKKRNKWLHTNSFLFKIPMVQKEITKIWEDFFSIGISNVTSNIFYPVILDLGKKRQQENKNNSER